MNQINSSDASYRMARFVLIFLGIWLLAVLTFFVIYNKKLTEILDIVEKQNVELAYASQAKTSFVSNVSHEIRTPINAVLGMNEMILKEANDPDIRSYAYDIRSAGNVLLSVINDVLDFSKIESGKMEIVETEYSIAKLIKEVYVLIQLKAHAKNLNLFINVAEKIPGILIGDDIRVKQIIVNLLTNAVKYTDSGSVTLRVFAERAEDGLYLDVSVSDTGIGLKPDELDHLFEEYGRLDMKRNHNTEGTGLGLPIVRRLLEMMGSELNVESKYGAGSNFYFKLKQGVKDETPIGKLNLSDKSSAEEKISNYDDVKNVEAAILVVDDTVLNLKVFTALLKDTKLDIKTCNSGMRALKMCDEEKYDLIFLDHRMPEMDGIETIHKLQESSLLNRDTPVVALTANVVSGAREMYIQEGFSDFLSKPINIASLNECIENNLIKRKGDKTDGNQ